jgi:hypothetical protein
MLFSVLNAYSPSVVTVPLTSKKLTSDIAFRQITDVHTARAALRFLSVMQRSKANAQFRCITGDFIDAPGIGEEQLSALLRHCPVPIYFSIGNHERRGSDQILQSLSGWASPVLLVPPQWGGAVDRHRRQRTPVAGGT